MPSGYLGNGGLNQLIKQTSQELGGETKLRWKRLRQANYARERRVSRTCIDTRVRFPPPPPYTLLKEMKKHNNPTNEELIAGLEESIARIDAFLNKVGKAPSPWMSSDWTNSTEIVPPTKLTIIKETNDRRRTTWYIRH